MEDKRPHVCEICGKSFKKMAGLTRHLVCHDDNRPFECEMCSKRFKLNHARRRHQRQVHTGEKPFTCGICWKGFHLMSPLETHLLSHCKAPASESDHSSETAVFDDVKNASIAGQDDRQKMLDSYVNDSLPTDNVDDNKTDSFEDIQAFVNPGKTYKNEVVDDIKISDLPLIQVSKENESATGIVVDGSSTIPNITDGNKLTVQSGIEISESDDLPFGTTTTESKNNGYGVANNSDESSGFICKTKTGNTVTKAISDENVANVISSTRNIGTADSSGVKECPICQKTYSYESHLKRHVATHGLSQNQIMCDLCGQTFTQKSSLNRHMILHSDKDPFVCEFCGKGFKFSYSAQIHRRSHTGIKPYTCEVCNKSFSNKPNLDSHFRIHTGEKPYECKICGRLFRQLNGVQHHEKTHSSTTNCCKICGLKRKSKASLRKHMRTHV